MTNQTVGRPAFATPESVALVAHVRDCEVCRPAFSVEAMCDHGVNLMVAAKINDHMRRLRGNDLVQLEECMIADPSIPSAPANRWELADQRFQAYYG